MKYATGKRLKLIADKLYDGNVSELARNLEMKPQALAKYVKGESMPGGLVLIRIYNLGVNINWFLMGEGEMLLHPAKGDLVAEPIAGYIGKLGGEELTGDERKAAEELYEFSSALKKLNISSALQRTLLLVYSRHLPAGKEE
ncbi:MAG: helix-turn-helix transcriptional regulator [Balneolaceae bacterium]